jgi:iron complex outermembrane receptor protein
MKITICGGALALPLLLCTAPAHADETAGKSINPDKDIVVTADKQEQTIVNPPNTEVALDASTIRTKVNAISVEDTIKYLPGLIVRKRHIGDNFAPIATRTSGLGSSARSLIYADGILLSALIANNNGNGSPKWQLVAPEEIDHIDVLYGPYSAAYPGNAIGAVVNITTRLPDSLEAHLDALGNIQWHSQYATARSFGTGQFSGSIGDRIGRLAFFAAATHTISNGQPVAYVTAGTAPAGTTGAIPVLNRSGQPNEVLGASDIDHHVEDTFKLKLAYDLSDTVRASYTGGLFLDDTHADVDTYLRNAAGNPVYTSGFNSGFYLRESRQWAHALSFTGDGGRLDWQVIGTLYDYGRDLQANPSGMLPASAAGGAGSVQDNGGTGWVTLDGKAAWRSGGKDAVGLDGDVLSFGAHYDRYRLSAHTYSSADWRDFAEGALTEEALGKTTTAAIWAQDEMRLVPGVSLTLGARQEWWRAYDGFNRTSGNQPGIDQPERTASGFSPKASLEWRAGNGWSTRLSLAQAWRFPTVGELYGAVMVGTILANPDPDLRPERARSGELAIEHGDKHSTVRLSLFDEVVHDALVSQTGAANAMQPDGSIAAVATRFVQNIERTRARGIELVVDRRDIVPGVDFTGSVTYADAITSKDTAFPAAEGKLLPNVPHWKGDAVMTWRPTDRLSLTAAARMASRNYGTLDNSDPISDTYQGFGRFFVVDLRGTYRLNDHLEIALGIDNLNDDRYFLYHPFPQRSITAELHWKL